MDRTGPAQDSPGRDRANGIEIATGRLTRPGHPPPDSGGRHLCSTAPSAGRADDPPPSPFTPQRPPCRCR